MPALLGVCTGAFSQSGTSHSLLFEALTINNGLSQGYVSDIVQDHQGLMWITTGDGLNRYDGYDFTVYHHDADDPFSLGSDDLTCIFEDSQKRLWIGTRQNGIDLFNRAENRFYHIRKEEGNGLRSNDILSIQEDKQGRLWVRTREGIDRLTITPFGQKKNSPAGRTQFPADVTFLHIEANSGAERQPGRFGGQDLFIDSRGRIFITTTTNVFEVMTSADAGYYKIEDRYRFQVIDSAFIPGMLEDTIHGNLLLNTKEIIRFPGFGMPATVYRHSRNDIRWTTDRKGMLWLADGDSLAIADLRTGIVRTAGASDPSFRKPLGAPTVFYTDRTGMIWIGTGGYGLLRYDPELEFFHHSLKGTAVYQLAEDKSGNIITNQLQSINISGPALQSAGPLVSTDLFASQFPKSLFTFSMDEAGDLWLGSKGALTCYSRSATTVTRFPVPLPSPELQPFPVLAGKDQNVWMGYGRYFACYNRLTGNFTFFDYPSEPASYDYDFLQYIYSDGELLWLGSVNGVFCFNTKRLQFVSAANGNSNWFKGGFIYSFCNDPGEPQKYLWLGTKGMGLNRLDKTTGVLTRFDKKKGLVNNVVYGMLPDGNGHLWLSTNRGLSRFTIATESFRNFDVSDGLQSNEFNRYAFLRTTGGKLVFGGMNGINFFDPALVSSLEAPPVIFTQFRLFNKKIEPGSSGSPLTQSIGFTNNIRLQYRQNVITIQFAAMDYRKHGSIRYRYRMKGFDEDWIHSGELREATYTNLDPGTYQFSVQAAYEDEDWGTGSAILTITIKTPWWRTWWFYCLSILLVAGGLYVLYQFRLSQFRRLEKLRNSIARDLHDEVGSSISTIAIYSKIVHEQVSNTTFNNEPLLQKISEHASEIMESMNDIVWNINTRNDAFEHIISRMREHASQLLEVQNYSLHFKFDGHLQHLRLTMEKRRDFYLIYKEALNNIAKYAHGKNAWISLTLSGNNLELDIRDDGVGFELGNERQEGNGLANMRFRATALKGKIHFDSTPGEGTHVYLICPMT